jgi:hypothetical protein
MYTFKPVLINDKLFAPAETADLKCQKKIIESKVHDIGARAKQKIHDSYQ